MKTDKYLAAMDVGGTKIICVLFDCRGNILETVKDAGITPVDAPLERCLERFRSVIGRLESRLNGRHLSALYCSVATCEHYYDAMYGAIRGASSADTVRIEPDGMALISGMLGHSDGAALICGTGSSLYLRFGEEISRVGGWGHYIDSCGSGYVLGVRAMKAVLRSHDGRDGPTLLTDIMNAKCGKPLWEDYDRIYALGRPYVASYASCVFEARRAGDKAACAIFDELSSDLSELVCTAYRRVGRSFSVVFNGGIFTHFPEYAEEVKRKCPDCVNVIFGDSAPVYGCAVEAMHTAGLPADETFKNNFLSGLD